MVELARQIYDRWRRARAAAWIELLSGLSEDERAQVDADMAARRNRQRQKARQAVERMKRVVEAYGCGMTADEIGPVIGVCGKEVRRFAARRGVTISRGKHRFRQVKFSATEEEALRRLADDLGSTPTQAVQALVKAALEQDAHPARRLLGVRRKARAAGGVTQGREKRIADQR